MSLAKVFVQVFIDGDVSFQANATLFFQICWLTLHPPLTLKKIPPKYPCGAVGKVLYQISGIIHPEYTKKGLINDEVVQILLQEQRSTMTHTKITSKFFVRRRNWDIWKSRTWRHCQAQECWRLQCYLQEEDNWCRLYWILPAYMEWSDWGRLQAICKDQLLLILALNLSLPQKRIH